MVKDNAYAPSSKQVESFAETQSELPSVSEKEDAKEKKDPGPTKEAWEDVKTELLALIKFTSDGVRIGHSELMRLYKKMVG